MQITVNSETLDYRLEDEATLGEVVGELEKWLGEAGMYIRSIDTNGSTIDLSAKAKWNGLSVDDIERMDVVAQTPFEFRIEKFESLYEYFVTLRDASDDAPEVVLDLLRERSGVAELLGKTLSDEAGQRYATIADTLFRARKETSVAIVPRDAVDALARYASDIVPILETRWREISDPRGSLSNLMPQLNASINELGEVSAYLQNGEDSEAMKRVLRFLEIAQALMRILYATRERSIALSAGQATGVPQDALPQESQIAGLQSELSELLGELSSAISDVDTITIGDLLEYEIGPRMLDVVNALGFEVADE